MTPSNHSSTRKRLHPGVIFLFLFLLVLGGVSFWLAFTSPAFAANPISATPTRSRAFAVANIAKPTYTPLPTLPPATAPAISAETPLATAPQTEEAPPFVAQAEIVSSEALSYDYVESVTEGEEPPPLQYTGGKEVLVDISEQHMYVYDGDQLIYSFVASTGMNNATRTGNFSVLNKIPSAYGSTWDIWMPSWLGIYWVGRLQNGIHALPILPNGATLWDGYLGTPISYGCVVLGAYEAQTLYDWVEVGTPVNIQW